MRKLNVNHFVLVIMVLSGVYYWATGDLRPGLVALMATPFMVLMAINSRSIDAEDERAANRRLVRLARLDLEDLRIGQIQGMQKMDNVDPQRSHIWALDISTPC